MGGERQGGRERNWRALNNFLHDFAQVSSTRNNKTVLEWIKTILPTAMSQAYNFGGCHSAQWSISSPPTSKNSLTVNRVIVWLLWAKGPFAFVDTSSVKNIKIIFYDHIGIKTNVFLARFIIMYLLFSFFFKFKR